MGGMAMSVGGNRVKVLPSERPSGTIRRVLHFFGLASATDDRFRQPRGDSVRKDGTRVEDDAAAQEARQRRLERREATERGSRRRLPTSGLPKIRTYENHATAMFPARW